MIIVTGGSSGMGKVMAKRFASEGANVVIVGRNQDRLDEARKDIEGETGKIFSFQADIREPEKVSELIQYVDSTCGRIDALINNAAGNFICPAEKLSINGWKSVIDIVLNGTFYCSSAVGKYWIEKQKKVRL